MLCAEYQARAITMESEIVVLEIWYSMLLVLILVVQYWHGRAILLWSDSITMESQIDRDFQTAVSTQTKMCTSFAKHPLSFCAKYQLSFWANYQFSFWAKYKFSFCAKYKFSLCAIYQLFFRANYQFSFCAKYQFSFCAKYHSLCKTSLCLSPNTLKYSSPQHMLFVLILALLLLTLLSTAHYFHETYLSI